MQAVDPIGPHLGSKGTVIEYTAGVVREYVSAVEHKLSQALTSEESK
jgi:hypothetical protein